MHPADVSRADEVDAAVAAADERWEKIDVLVNNAGIAEEKPFLEIEDDGWDRVLATNLRGAFLMAQRVARVQAAAGGGAIVHIASIDASGGDGPYASYNASKAGLLGLNRTMALELGPSRRARQLRQPRLHAHGDDRGRRAAGDDGLPRQPLRPRPAAPPRPARRRSPPRARSSPPTTPRGSQGIDLTVDCGLTANWYILESIPAADG